MSIPQEEKSTVIKAITSPLGFFALSLLIVEGFLGIVLIFSDLDSSHKFFGMLIGAVLFFLVVWGVWWLVKNCPENLTFGENSYIEKIKLEKQANWGTSEKPESKFVIDEENSEELSTGKL